MKQVESWRPRARRRASRNSRKPSRPSGPPALLASSPWSGFLVADPPAGAGDVVGGSLFGTAFAADAEQQDEFHRQGVLSWKQLQRAHASVDATRTLIDWGLVQEVGRLPEVRHVLKGLDRTIDRLKIEQDTGYDLEPAELEELERLEEVLRTERAKLRRALKRAEQEAAEE